MKINIDVLTQAVQTIIDNQSKTYEELVQILQAEFPEVNIDDYLTNFILGLQYAYMKQTTPDEIKQWIIDLYNSGVSVEQITERIAETVATAFMKFFLEPVYIIKNNQIVYTATNPVVEQIYKDKKELETIQAELENTYTELTNVGFTNEQLQAIVNNRDRLLDFITLTQRKLALEERITQLTNEVI